MKDLKIILENVDDICEKFEMEGLHTHPTYKQFKRLFTELSKIAEPLHPLQQTLRENGELIAAQATIAQQAQMIEHLRGATIPCYTTSDIANADADGFKNGRKSVGLLLGKGFNTLNQVGGKYSITLAFQNADDAYAAYTEIATVVSLAGEA